MRQPPPSVGTLKPHGGSRSGRETRRESGAARSPIPRWLIVAFVVVLFLGMVTVLFWGIYRPSYFQSSTAKFFTCFILSICASVFIFFLYPARMSLSRIPLLDLPVKLVGPSVLFVVVLLLTWKLYPFRVGRLFQLSSGGSPVVLQVVTTKIIPKGTGCDFYKVVDSRDYHFIGGIFVNFNDSSGSCKAWVGDSPPGYLFEFVSTARSDVANAIQEPKAP